MRDIASSHMETITGQTDEASARQGVGGIADLERKRRLSGLFSKGYAVQPMRAMGDPIVASWFPRRWAFMHPPYTNFGPVPKAVSHP